MILTPTNGTDYTTAEAACMAYNAGAQFLCVNGGTIDRYDIVNYTGVQEVVVLYNQQRWACVVDARRPHH